MSFLLDTCVVSEFTKVKPDSKVIDWLRGSPQDQLFISSITLGELSRGIALLDDGTKKSDLEKWITFDIINRFNGKIIELDAEIMLGWGKLSGVMERLGMKMAVMDSLIAACAIAHDLTLVTNNTDDFINSHVKIMNPWKINTQ